MIYDMTIVRVDGAFASENRCRLVLPRGLDVLEIRRFRPIWDKKKRYGYSIPSLCAVAFEYKVYYCYEEHEKWVKDWRTRNDNKRRQNY